MAKSINGIFSPTVHRRTISGRRVANALRAESAAAAIGLLAPGCEIFGFTKGQFSLIHLLDAIIEQVGDADVVVATWSAADGDVEHAKQWLEAGRVRSLRMLVDFSFERRKPDVCQIMRDRFGDDSIRVTVTHAKFVLVRAGAWRLVVRTSMNLTHNPRFENFEISDDPAMFEFLAAIVDEVWAVQSPGEGFVQHPGANRRDWDALFKVDSPLPAQSALVLPAIDARDLLP